MEDISESKFDNLDSWAPGAFTNRYEKEILSKLLKKKKPEDSKDSRQVPQADPFPIGGGIPRGGGSQPIPVGRPHIIGDPYIQ